MPTWICFDITGPVAERSDRLILHDVLVSFEPEVVIASNRFRAFELLRQLGRLPDDVRLGFGDDEAVEKQLYPLGTAFMRRVDPAKRCLILVDGAFLGYLHPSFGREFGPYLVLPGAEPRILGRYIMRHSAD